MKCFIAMAVVLVISTGFQALKCTTAPGNTNGVECKADGPDASSCMVVSEYNEGEFATEKHTFHSCSNSVKAACVQDGKKNICYCDKDNCNDVTKCNCAMTRYASTAENL
jgi:hypothetical protein